MRTINSRYLNVTQPFNLGHSYRFANKFPVDSNKGEEEKFFGATKYKGEVVIYQISDHGGFVELEIISEDYWSRNDIDIITEEISNYLSLEDNLHEFYQIAETDLVFRSIKNKLFGYHQVKFTTPYKAACWAIISARNNLTHSKSQMNRLIFATRGIATLNGMKYSAFPNPYEVLQLPVSQLSKIIGEKKSQYIKNVSEFFADFGLTKLKQMSTESLYEHFERVVGIGSWSASLIAIRGLGRMEELRSPEKRLQKIVKDLYKSSVEESAIRYSSYKAYWAHYLRYWYN